MAFGIWVHLRPPAMASGALLFISLLVLLSFTHGYLPYGSSDVLLPSLGEQRPKYLWPACFVCVYVYSAFDASMC